MAIAIPGLKPKAMPLSLLIEQAGNTRNNRMLHEIIRQWVEGKRFKFGSCLLITVDGETTHVLWDRDIYYFPSEQEALVVDTRRILGEGGYGKVYPVFKTICFSKGVHTDGVTVNRVNKVLKSQPVTPKQHDLVKQEADCSRRIYRDVSQVLFSQTSGGEQKAYFSMERCSGVPLQKILENLSFIDLSLSGCLLMALKIIEAVANVHQKGVLHRDLNPENIMLDIESRVVNDCRVVEDCRAAIIDFGLSSTQESLPRAIRRGFSPYKDVLKRNFLIADDIYAVAVSLEKLLVQKRKVIKRSTAKSDSYAQLYQQTKELINAMKDSDPTKRPTTDQLMDIFYKTYIAVFKEELAIHRASCRDYEVNNSASFFSKRDQISLSNFIDLIKELINKLKNRKGQYSYLNSQTTTVTSCHQNLTVTC